MPKKSKSTDKLTPKQEEFVRLIVWDGLSQTEAYIRAYPRAKSWKRSSVYTEACKNLQNTKISQRKIEMEKERDALLRKPKIWNKHKSEEELTKVVSAAANALEESGFDKDASEVLIKALKALNEMYGFSKTTELAEEKQAHDLGKDGGMEEVEIIDDIN